MLSIRGLEVKKATVSLDGEYAGFELVVRTNPSMGEFSKLASSNLDKIAEALSTIILDWNFVVDESGKAVKPSIEAVSILPMNLVTLIVRKLTEEIAKLPPA